MQDSEQIWRCTYKTRFPVFNEGYLVNHLRDILDYSCRWLVFKYSYRCKGPQNAFCFTLNYKDNSSALFHNFRNTAANFLEMRALVSVIPLRNLIRMTRGICTLHVRRSRQRSINTSVLFTHHLISLFFSVYPKTCI